MINDSVANHLLHLVQKHNIEGVIDQEQLAQALGIYSIIDETNILRLV